jgi:hypothetical protein
MFDAVGPCDFMGNVGHDGKFDRSDAALVDRGVSPGKMGILGIDGHPDDFHVPLLELLEPMAMGQDFGGTDECKIQGPKKQHHVISSQVGELEMVLDNAVRHYGRSRKIRCLSRY